MELAATFQIDENWSVAASGNVTTRQINVGTTYANGEGFDASVKVDNIADVPRLGVGLGLELSSSTKLEVSASDLTGNPTLGVRVTQKISL